ncbi:MAG: GNAT family N-acetyltransferase [Actinomycetota bacterium]
MERLCSAILRASPGRAAVHPGDIAWWVGWRLLPAGRPGQAFLLWEIRDELVGVAAADEGDLSVFITPTQVDSIAALDFEEAALAWASRDGAPEAVATHPYVHGRGFAKALLTDGLRRFAAAGMTYAIVGVQVGNTPAEALYRSVGFRPDRMLRVYARP